MKSIRSRAPAATSGLARRVMQANVGKTTAPERQLRSALHWCGLRFRTNCCPSSRVKCKADVVFTRSRVCVFVDGCFWHGCPTHFRPPRVNTEWWVEKIADNVKRDADKTRALEKEGWAVIRVWEHDIVAPPARLAAVVARIRSVCIARGTVVRSSRKSMSIAPPLS